MIKSADKESVSNLSREIKKYIKLYIRIKQKSLNIMSENLSIFYRISHTKKQGEGLSSCFIQMRETVKINVF